jgi:putative transposase
VQYVSTKYTERLAAARIEPSVGSVGDSYDNALAETVIGLFKTEGIHRQGPWRSLEAVEVATLTLGLLLKAAASLSGLLACCSQGLDWYDHRRLLGSIGDIPPAEAEASHDAALEATPVAA